MRGCYTGDYKRHIGLRIREARKANGFSHDRLAAAAGMSGKGARQHLIKLEQGKHLPRDETLRAIATATGRDVEWFVPAIPEPRANRRSRYDRARATLEEAA